MQHKDKTVLCQSESGSVSVFNNAVAYELRFRQMCMILTSEQLLSVKNTLQNLKRTDWFATSRKKFVFFHPAHSNGNYLLAESEVEELLRLLLEASAMIKVHHKLLFKPISRIN